MCKALLLACLCSLLSSLCFAQTTTVTATITDPSGQVFYNGTVQVSYKRPPSKTGVVPLINGVPVVENGLSATMNSSGQFTIVLADLSKIAPTGGSWSFNLCPLASAQCQVVTTQAVAGPAIDLSAVLSSQLVAITVAPATTLSLAYSNAEVVVTPGSLWLDIALEQLKYVDTLGTVHVIGAGGGGGSLPTQNPPSSPIVNLTPTLTSFLSGIEYTPSVSSLNWSQTITGSLTGGTPATVTLTPCPIGVDITGLNLYEVALFSSGNTVYETPQVTGGTCTSGASSGTVTFTPVNTYTTSYTIKSASSGIQEAWNASCGLATNGYLNGQCNVIIPANNTNSNNANSYPVYGTIFLHGGQSTLSGYGAKLYCLGRGPCIQVGDLVTNASNYPSTTVQGIAFDAPGHSQGAEFLDWLTSAAYAGVNITNTAETSGVQTINTATAHGFQIGDMVTLLFTNNSSYWGTGMVTSVPSLTSFTIKGSGTITISSQATPGVVALAFTAVLDNATNTHLVDLSYDQNNSNFGRFNNFFEFFDDENATVSHFQNNSINLHQGLTWSASYFFSGGSAHSLSGQQYAPVITVRDSTITANFSNCATIYNSNGFYFENTVCQASGLWQFNISNTRGNFQGANISNLYSDGVACSNNPATGNITSPFPGLGIAGVIFGESTGASRYKVVGGNGVGGCIPTAGSGSTALAYYIVVNDTTKNWHSAPELVEYWNSTGTDAPLVNWPLVANGQDVITFDVLRMAAAVNNSATPPAYNGTPFPFASPGSTTSCPGGTGGTCTAVTTNLSPASACVGLVCSFTDNAASAGIAYAIPTIGNYQGQLNFWPGGLVYSGEGTVTTPVVVSQELANPICFGCGGSPIQVADTCNVNPSTGPDAYDICLSDVTANGVGQAARLYPEGFPGSNFVASKGAINFTWLGNNLIPHAFITFSDSQAAQTRSTRGYRQPWNAYDFHIGLDNAGGISALTQPQGFIGSGYSLSEYIGALPNGTSVAQSSSWVRRLTATLEEHKLQQQFDSSIILQSYTYVAETTPGGVPPAGYELLTGNSATHTLICTTSTNTSCLPGVSNVLYSAAGTPLPTCASAYSGVSLVVNDATTPTYMGTYVSGGAVEVSVICTLVSGTYSWKTN